MTTLFCFFVLFHFFCNTISCKSTFSLPEQWGAGGCEWGEGWGCDANCYCYFHEVKAGTHNCLQDPCCLTTGKRGRGQQAYQPRQMQSVVSLCLRKILVPPPPSSSTLAIPPNWQLGPAVQNSQSWIWCHSHSTQNRTESSQSPPWKRIWVRLNSHRLDWSEAKPFCSHIEVELTPSAKSSYDWFEITSYQLFQNITWAGQTTLSMESIWTGQLATTVSKPSLSCFFFSRDQHVKGHWTYTQAHNELNTR